MGPCQNGEQGSIRLARKTEPGKGVESRWSQIPDGRAALERDDELAWRLIESRTVNRQHLGSRAIPTQTLSGSLNCACLCTTALWTCQDRRHFVGTRSRIPG